MATNLPRVGGDMSRPASELRSRRDPMASSKTMFYNNKMKSTSTNMKTKALHYNALKSVHCSSRDPDKSWRSTATNFARGGISDTKTGNTYIRDPRTGVWFKNSPSQQFPNMEPSPIRQYVVEEGSMDASFASTWGTSWSSLARSSTAPGSLRSSGSRRRFVSRPDVIPFLSTTVQVR
eukprot:TRINITY_DN9570_c0_g1_i1.p1 TRINITY_DN9570_c0_g1~~TRINITY_DN9570_c0_g1_i1.p1  ORF type:complete len:200 (+),score=30.82 TRINITY_DN9570_c0_g1_i1:68-601(+)